MKTMKIKLAVFVSIYAFSYTATVFAEETVENNSPPHEERQAKRDQRKAQIALIQN